MAGRGKSRKEGMPETPKTESRKRTNRKSTESEATAAKENSMQKTDVSQVAEAQAAVAEVREATDSGQQAFVTQYDMASKERYVDSTSQKTEFDRVLDELTRISKEKLEWDLLGMTRKHFGETEEENMRKLEAFLGGVIINAATELYDKGGASMAFRKLDQAKTVLEAKQKLSQEVEAIKAKSGDDLFDVSDMLGLFDSSEE